MPDTPAMEVISPYRKPPCSTAESISSRPELAGAGVDRFFARAASSSTDANCPGAVSAAPDVLPDIVVLCGLAEYRGKKDKRLAYHCRYCPHPPPCQSIVTVKEASSWAILD